MTAGRLMVSLIALPLLKGAFPRANNGAAVKVLAR